MKRLSFLLAGAGLTGLAACQTAPQGVQISAAPSGEQAPVDAPVEFVESPYGNSPRFNAMGGEIPRAAPDGRVEEYSLPEVGPGAAG